MIKKRVEENQKLFFKKAFKFVEKNYFAQKKNKKRIVKREKNYDDFYDHYFGEDSKNKQIDMANYYHP